jgi:hypothetical protein
MRNIGAPYGLKVSSLRSDHSVVIDVNGNPLKTHLKTAFIPMPTKVVHQLVEDINELPINAELTESLVFCLLSTFSIEESPNFQLYLDTDLQWDAAYRLSDDDEIAELQHQSIAGITKRLKDNYVSLPINPSSTVEEMQQADIEFVPDNILVFWKEFTADFNQYQIYVVELLQSIFGGIHLSMILLWVKGKVSGEDLMKSSLFLSCYKEDLESPKFSKQERADVEYFSKRLAALRETLTQLSAQ